MEIRKVRAENWGRWMKGELSLGEPEHEAEVFLSEARGYRSPQRGRGYNLPVILKMVPMSSEGFSQDQGSICSEHIQETASEE